MIDPPIFDIPPQTFENTAPTGISDETDSGFEDTGVDLSAEIEAIITAGPED